MKKIILSALLSFISLASFAQGKHADPRIMKGLDASKIPALKSFKDLKVQPGGLAARAVQVGKVEMIWNDAGKAQTISADPKQSLPQDFSLWRILRSDNGTVNWMWRASTHPQKQTVQSIKNTDGLQVLSELKTALRIRDPKSEFFQMSAATDELGFQHLRYAQQYQGIPVWNRDLYVHLDASGEAYTINGTYEPTPKNILTTPNISNPYSIILTIADLKTQGRWAPVGADVAKALGFSEPSSKLVLYPDHRKLRLAYEVSIVPNLLESFYYIIDAANGEILTKIQRSCSLVPSDPKSPPVTISHFAAAPNNAAAQPLAGFADASGTDLNGVTQQLRTYQHTDGNFYAIWDLKPSFNFAASTLPDQPSGGAMTLTLKNQDYTQNSSIFHNISSDNSWGDPDVVSAHHNMLVTYNYYNNTFQRKAIDDKNGAIVSIIHVTQNGQGMDNAFWNGSGKVMIYGDGNVNFKPLAGGIDVAGHEMTHGVINNTCDLVYQFQSGALNESMADVFGIMVDTRTLTVGKDIMKDGKTCLRNLANPHDPNALSDQPAHMNEIKNLTADQDNGGVHINSGIPNKAAAILIQQLGRDKVQRMYYLALTKFLTRNSQFIDCRIAIQSAAKELFGAGSNEFNAVGPAFDAVGISGPATDPNKDDIPSQTGGSEYIGFTNSVGDIGLYNPATNKFTIPGTAGLTARVSSNGNSRAQLTTTRNGSHGYFITPTGHLNYVEIATGNVFTFPNLHIQADGDLWNAAVAPDESAVALTSSYLNDPNVYIFDGTNIFTQPIKPENTDAGAIATIDYPDVLSWSPNKSQPKIGFDALLDDQYGSSSIKYWSMYELDFTSKKTYDLFPAQNSNIDIGNIAYSNSSPNVITFNSIINGNDWDVWVADFKNNNIGFLGVDKRTINGNPVLDAQKPSFSPNDQSLVFASPSNNSLLFYRLSDKNLSFIQFPAAVYQPYWFLLGGSAGVHDAKTNPETLSVNPSTISENGTASFSLNTTGEITLDIVNLFGQTVRTISKERIDAGSHKIKFNANGLSSGTYFIRLLTKDGQEMVKVVVEK